MDLPISPSDPDATAKDVLQRCINNLKLWRDQDGAPLSKTDARNRLLRGLHRSFEEVYRAGVAARHVAVMSLEQTARCSALQWTRSEFLHDICVAEIGETRSAYRGESIGFVRRVLWQVESEISNNGGEVAEDLSKLIAGRADHKLLITARPRMADRQPWLDFLSRLWHGNGEPLLIAMVESYAIADWRAAWCVGHGPCFDLYRLEPFAASPTGIAARICAEPVVTPSAPG